MDGQEDTDAQDSDSKSDDWGASRRNYLLTAGGLAAASIAGCAERDALGERPESDAQAEDEAASGGEGAAGGTADRERDDFLWMSASIWKNERHRDNLFAFAGRHDLAVVIVKTHSNVEGIGEIVRRPLEAASEFGLDAWLNVGVLEELSATEFVNDRSARETHLDRLREVARVHGELFDGGRVILWQEEPVMSRWTDDGGWNRAAVDNLLEYGPQVFDAQRRAIEEANEGLEVGNFVHFPYIVDSKRPEVFAELTDRFRGRGAMPDFAFTDFYRGWYEKDAGPEVADAAVRSLLSNASEHLGGRDVFYIGQTHTVNPRHTPSKQAMRMNLRASLEAEAAGLGWYSRTKYVPTERGFDPFVPNVDGADIRGQPATTATFARDRFLYPWMATFATRSSYATDDRFDLYLSGDELGFYDHRLSVRTGDGWEFLGDAGRTVGGDYPRADGATIFRALNRERLFDDDGELELRIESGDDGGEASLDAAYAMPWNPDAFVTETAAAEFVEGAADLEPYSYGHAKPSAPLTPGETRRITIPATEPEPRSLDRLLYPGHEDVLRQLSAVEGSDGFDRRSRFDLWIAGSGLEDPAAAPSVVDADGDRRAPADAGVTAAAADGVALFFGLDRDRFLDGTGLEIATDADSGVRVDAAYAMPYAGSDAFRSPSHAADLVAEQPGEVETFSVARARRR